MRAVMPRAPHIVIIGAGLIGLSTADYLSQYGAAVTVIEQRSGPALGASFCNSGMIHPSQAAPWLDGEYQQEARSVWELAERSRHLLEARMASLNMGPRSRVQGCIQLFDTQETAHAALRRCEALGVVCENISGTPSSYGYNALKFPDDWSANAYEYCKALEADLTSRSVKFSYGETSLPEADHIVIAAGTGSVSLARRYGAELPVQPLRGHALNFAKPKTDLPRMPLMHFASRSALTVFEDHLRLSGTTGAADPDILLEIWEAILPDIVNQLSSPLSRWSEDRPMSQLGRPIIGQIGPGVWVNAGHGHMGWTLSAGSGERLAQMIMHGLEDNRFALPQ